MRYSITYEIVTHESAELGEAAESGFELEDCECDPEEAANEWSNHCFDGGSDGYSWYVADAEVDYMTGDCTTRAYHFDGSEEEMAEFWSAIKFNG
jgi:hypothetical protein